MCSLRWENQPTMVELSPTSSNGVRDIRGVVVKFWKCLPRAS